MTDIPESHKTVYGSAVTTYGTFNAYINKEDAPTIEIRLAAATGDRIQDVDLNAIVTEWRQTVNNALPAGITLKGQELVGPAPFDYPLSECIPAAFAAADVQLDEIISRYHKNVST